MQSIEFYRESNLILNQIYDILEEFKNQGKHIILCKVPAFMKIKGNEAADKITNRNAKSGHFKTFLYRLLLSHMEG